MAAGLKRKREFEAPTVMPNHKNIHNGLILALPSLHDTPFEASQPPSPKKRRKSSRIEAAGPRKKYIEQEIEEYIEYQFELEKTTNWYQFVTSTILKRYNLKIIHDPAELNRLFNLFFIGMHIDFEDDDHEWYEAIIERVKITHKTKPITTDIKHESEIFDRFNIKLFIHIKHFSSFWDQWLCLPSKRIAVLRTYSHAYDADDNVKPLGEILREFDSEEIVSIDFIADSLRLDRGKFIKFINQHELDFEDPNAIHNILKWIKNFLNHNKQMDISHYKICLDHFVKPGTNGTKTKDILFEAILPSTLSTKLEMLSTFELSMIQNVAIDNLRNNNCDYKEMCSQCKMPLGLFQEIVFGITVLLPRFIIDRMVQWAKGIHVDDIDLAVKEERLFFVKVV